MWIIHVTLPLDRRKFRHEHRIQLWQNRNVRPIGRMQISPR